MNGSTLHVCKGIDVLNVFLSSHLRSFDLSSHNQNEEESVI